MRGAGGPPAIRPATGGTAIVPQAARLPHLIGNQVRDSLPRVGKGTVEEKVLQMQQRKQGVIDATLEKGGEMGTSLSRHDVQELLSV